MKVIVKKYPVLENLEKLKKARVTVGWFEDTKYDDDTSVAQVAYWQEYGTQISVSPKMRAWFRYQGVNLKKNLIVIPPRPFMRPAEMKNENKWLHFFNNGLKQSINNGTSLVDLMSVLGLIVQGDIQQEISDLKTPALSDFTIQRRLDKKSSNRLGNLTKPLIDTGILFETIQSKAEETE